MLLSVSTIAIDGYRLLPIGHSLSGLEGKSLTGKCMRLGELKRPAVIFFFEPGCEMCRAIVPGLTDLYLRTADSLQWVGVTHVEDSTRIADFILDTGMPWEVIRISKKSWDECMIDATPTIYLTDRKNRIATGRLVRSEDLIPLIAPGR